MFIDIKANFCLLEGLHHFRNSQFALEGMNKSMDT